MALDLFHSPRRGTLRARQTLETQVAANEFPLAYMPPYPFSVGFTKLMWIPEDFDYVVGGINSKYFVTLDNSSTLVPHLDGIRAQTQASPTGGDDIDCTSNLRVVLTAAKRITMWAQIRKSDADDIGFFLGLSSAVQGGTGIDFFGTAPADAVGFKSAIDAATVVGTVIENGQAADDTGTLATLTDGTYLSVGFTFKANTDLALCEGAWYVSTDHTTYTKTDFTANQLAALDAMVTTTAPTLCGHWANRVNGTTQRNVNVRYAYLVVEY